MSFEERLEKLNEIQRGWVNYFRMASLRGKLKDLDSWVRNRLRYCIWSRMISGEETGAETEKSDPFGGRLRSCLRLEPDQNGRLGGSSKPYSAETITLKRLTKRGYQSMLEYYLKVSPSVNPARAGPYTACRPVRTVV